MASRGGSSTRPARRSGNRDKRIRISRGVAWIAGAIGLIVPIAVIGVVIAFLFTFVTATVPAPGDMRQNQVATILYSDGEQLAEIVPPEGNRTMVSINDIPVSLQEAVIAAEDREFRSNQGFSTRGLTRAVLGQITNNDDAGGGSTITQQYVKNTLVGDERSFERKFKELAIATKMTSEWSKDDILEAYLNTIYFGRGAYGVAAAAQAYFRTDVSDLDTSQSALLAAVIRSPSYYDPVVNEAAAEARWEYVLDGMVQTGALTPAERSRLQFPQVSPPQTVSDNTSEPVGLIKRQVLAELTELGITEQEVQTGGLRITTSIDKQVQEAVTDASESVLANQPSSIRDAVVSIDPQTGGIKGYYGGSDGQGWDYAQAGLQTGSTFKVFALLAALDQDIPLSQTYDSSPLRVNSSLTVQNAGGDSCGTCNIATATKMSLNTVFYRLMMDLDNQAEDVRDAAFRAGVARSIPGIEHTLQEPNGDPEGGIVLGQYPSRVVDMASAYATIAASGIYREPFMVEKVETSRGNVIYEREPNQGERVFPAKVADNVTAALQPVAAYSGGSLYDSSLGYRPSASKTGTVQFGDTGLNKDAWMVGYTPQLVTAVWVGAYNEDNEPIALRTAGGASVYGAGLPTQIWKAAMDDALAGESIESFPNPAAVGGQAGVPYEPPPTTYTQDYTQAPSTPQTTIRTPARPQLPSISIPGVELPELPSFGGGDDGYGGGNSGGNDYGGGNDYDGGYDYGGGYDSGGGTGGYDSGTVPYGG